MLLKDLGAREVEVRVQDIPDGQRLGFIVERAVARRQLTPAQKRSLNDLLREQVIEVREPSSSAAQRGTPPMRIGYSQTERAEKLGVDRTTVAEWDAEPLVVGNPTTRGLPTHAIDKRGRPQPLHKARESAPERPHAAPRPAPKVKREAPRWRRHFTTWCRHVLPEDAHYRADPPGCPTPPTDAPGREKGPVVVLCTLRGICARLHGFTPSEAVAIADALRPEAERQARERQRAGVRPSGNFPEGLDRGRARDALAAAVGLSGRTLDKAKAVVEAAEADPELGDLVSQMDASGKVDAAYRELTRRRNRQAVDDFLNDADAWEARA